MVRFKHKGDFSKTTRYLMRLKETARIKILNKYGEKGVAALASATPKETGRTAESWTYKIISKQGFASIEFHNTNIQNGVPIAIILQYGHGTGTGGWVEGRDYINPTIQPIFEQISQEAWREVTSL